MANIEAYADPLVAAIYEYHERRNSTEKARTYLGASILGRECERALWYSFRWASKEFLDGRKLRLFQTGFMAEPRFIVELRAIGVTVRDVDPANGKQFGFSDFGGHMRGHMDGCARGVPGGGQQWHVLEFKTHSAKSFAELKKSGVKKAKWEHYAQMQWYMGQSGMTRALYLAVNKDTDELYSERVEFDALVFAELQAKAERIIFAADPPAKIATDPKYYLCTWCQHQTVCHGHRTPALSCRTCVHATPEREGNARWSCQKHGPDIPESTQRTGCGNHLPLPFLITYADPVDAGDGWILFQRKDDAKQFIVTDEATLLPADLPLQNCIYASKEISAANDHRAIGDTTTEAWRHAFQGQLVG